MKEGSETTNRRTLMTRRLLKDSLIELMKDKPIHAITIKEICDNADVNRSTFYRHYDTQFDLYRDIYTDVANDLCAISEKYDSVENDRVQIMTEILTYVERHRELCMTLLSENGSVSIGETFTGMVRNILLKNRRVDRKNSELELYVVQFISAGMANIVWTWLKKDERLSPSDMARVVNMLIVNGLKRGS